MRDFKWSPNFNVDIKSSIVSVWIKLDRLPIHRFNKVTFYSIGKFFGETLKLDAATVSMVRPSMVRICTELDAKKSLIDQVCIGNC